MDVSQDHIRPPLDNHNAPTVIKVPIMLSTLNPLAYSAEQEALEIKRH